MELKYNSIDREIIGLGLTKKRVASILGVSVNTLNYRIKQDKPTIHWAIYGIANYYGGTDQNLRIEDEALRTQQR